MTREWEQCGAGCARDRVRKEFPAQAIYHAEVMWRDGVRRAGAGARTGDAEQRFDVVPATAKRAAPRAKPGFRARPVAGRLDDQAAASKPSFRLDQASFFGDRRNDSVSGSPWAPIAAGRAGACATGMSGHCGFAAVFVGVCLRLAPAGPVHASSTRLGAPAALRAELHRAPVARPFAPPGEGQAAGGATLGRQLGFLLHPGHDRTALTRRWDCRASRRIRRTPSRAGHRALAASVRRHLRASAR